jgi:hypothetical protein
MREDHGGDTEQDDSRPPEKGEILRCIGYNG